jgi:hypothetical protein
MNAKPFPQQLADQPRLRDYKANLDFYNGLQWPGRRTTDKRRRLTLNYARTIVEKTAAYTMAGRTIRILPAVDSPEADALAHAAEAVLREATDANSLDRIDFDTEIDTAVLGDGAFKVAWNQADSRPIVTAPDVQGIFVWPMPHNLTDYWQVAHRYTLTADQALAAFGVKPTKPTATIVERWTDPELEIWLDNALVSTDPNPYGLIPFVIFPNSPVPKQFWGASDITPIRDVAQELNREVSVLSTIMELSGNPITVLAGVDEAQDIAIDAGAVWTLPAEAKAYLLDLLSGGGVSLHVEYINTIYRALHDLAETPRTTFGDTGRALSGVALQMEVQPLLQKVARKRLIRTAAYARRARIVLALTDLFTGTAHLAAGTITVNWGDVTPEDKPSDAATETQLWQAGLSAATTSMSRLGADDPDAEWAKVIEQARQLAEAKAPTAPTPQP